MHFDILVHEGRRLTELPLLECRAILSPVVEPGERVALSQVSGQPAAEMLRFVKSHGLEGAVAKRSDSVYHPGQRTGVWSCSKGVANREQAGVPKISSGVFVIDPTSKVIMHMYDDRGLDIIAAELNTLRPLFKIFGDWILNSQRHRVEFRFKTSIQELPE
jgi:hypothetical protein